MPRRARQKSSTGIYHVVMRGIDRRTIFEDAEDFAAFVGILATVQNMTEMKIFAYCLMDNHFHLLIKESEYPVSNIMNRICSRYCAYFQHKYESVGHLFQNRFYSSPVEDDQYFACCMEYIMDNPVKAGIVKNAADYCWLGRGTTGDCADVPQRGAQGTLVLSPCPEEWAEAVGTPGDSTMCPSLRSGRVAQSPSSLAAILCLAAGCSDPAEIANMHEQEKITAIAAAIAAGASLRQIVVLTGISKSAVDRLKKKSAN